MADYTLDDATARLPDLIDRARSGEAVVLVRDGEAVAEIRPVGDRGSGRRTGVMTQEDWEWLKARRVPCRATIDAATLVRQMRDEDGEW